METLAVEAIRASQSATAAQTASPDGLAPSGPIAPPSASAVARFEAAMAPDAVGRSADSSAAIPFASQVSAAWRSAQTNNQGMVHRIRALAELQGSHSLSAAELVELQYEVMNLSFQQEVVTKVADKTSTAVQTLVKNQ